ncbi:hypothetical protein [Pseudoalteromonas phage J2-1_QLiu-2017]|nr:hypothetical protein [Pseudoalteromonas phage J2-1_QLiu-2017]
MAINPALRFGSRIDNTDPNMPFGKPINRSGGISGTGTPLTSEWVQDLWGFSQALMVSAGMTPDNTFDEVGDSQVEDAIRIAIAKQVAISGGLVQLQDGNWGSGKQFTLAKHFLVTRDARIYTPVAGVSLPVTSGVNPDTNFAEWKIDPDQVPVSKTDFDNLVLNFTALQNQVNLNVTDILNNFNGQATVNADFEQRISDVEALALDNFRVTTNPTIEVNAAKVQRLDLPTLVNNVTFTDLPTYSGRSYTLTLIVRQKGGGQAINWPSNIRWHNGITPVLGNLDGMEDIFQFIFVGSNSWPYAIHTPLHNLGGSGGGGGSLAQLQAQVNRIEDDIEFASNNMSKYVTDTGLAAFNYQTAAMVDTAITARGYKDEAELDTWLATKNFLTDTAIDTLITGKGYLTTGQVDARIDANATVAASKTVTDDVTTNDTIQKANDAALWVADANTAIDTRIASNSTVAGNKNITDNITANDTITKANDAKTWIDNADANIQTVIDAHHETELTNLRHIVKTTADLFPLENNTIVFSQMGKHASGSLVQDGLSTHPTDQALIVGSKEGGDGASNTSYPVLNLFGTDVILNHAGVGNFTRANVIVLPDAEDGTTIYNEVTDTISVATDTTTAFNGLLSNGDFSKGDDGIGWLGYGSDWTITTNGASSNGASDNNRLRSEDILLPDTTYTIEIDIEVESGDPSLELYEGTYVVLQEYLQSGTYKHTFTTAANNNGRIYVQTDTGDVCHVRAIRLYQEKTKVVTERQDLVFLETWVEDITTKDWFCPYGNVQSNVSNVNGVAAITAEFAVLNGFVAFDYGYLKYGDWEEDADARQRTGIVWSSLTQEDKIKLAMMPENNLYYDPITGQWLQLRYRWRVVKGEGNDWRDENILPYKGNSNDFQYSNTKNIAPQGSLDVSTPFGTGGVKYSADPEMTGAFKADITQAYGVDGHCYAIPLALVQRLNKGGFHPFYNPFGTAKMFNTNGAVGEWYESWANTTLDQPRTKSHCFDARADLAGTGSFATTISGNGKFHDLLYPELVKDLRSATRRRSPENDSKRILEVVKGNVRGWGEIPYTWSLRARANTSGDTIKLSDVRPLFWKDYWPSTNLEISVSSISHNLTVNINGTTFYIVTVGFDGEYYIKVSDVPRGTPVTSGAVVGTRFSVTFLGQHSPIDFRADTWTISDLVGTATQNMVTAPLGWAGTVVKEVPDGSTKDFFLTHKTASATRYRTSDGLVYTKSTPTVSNNTVNIAGLTTESNVCLYETKLATFGVSQVKELAGDYKIFDTTSTNLLTRMVLTGDETNLLSGSIPVNSFLFLDTNKTIKYNGIDEAPLNDSDKTVVVAYVTEDNGLPYIQIVGKTLSYDSTQFDPWGDNYEIPVVNNYSVILDGNNTPQLNFCLQTKVPLDI